LISNVLIPIVLRLRKLLFNNLLISKNSEILLKSRVIDLLSLQQYLQRLLLKRGILQQLKAVFNLHNITIRELPDQIHIHLFKEFLGDKHGVRNLILMILPYLPLIE